MKDNVWLTYDEKDVEELEKLSDEYKAFLSRCKTERECVSQVIEDAKAAGYEDLNEVVAQGKTLKPGDKVYCAIMGKSIALFHLGERPLEEGMNIVGAHIDSPRLDLKQNPL